MRTLLAVMACVLVACGGAYRVEPEVPDEECLDLSCPLALGSEVIADAVFASDIVERVAVADATVDPRELVEVTWVESRLRLRPRVAGTGMLSVETDGATFETPVRVVPVASTAVVPHGLREVFPDGVLPGGRLALFEGSRVRVVAEHRAASGERLLGSGLEAWFVEGGTLAAADDVPVPALVRDVQATSGGTVTVSAGAGPALAIDVVAPGATAALELFEGGARRPPGPFRLIAGHHPYVRVLPFTSDGRYVHGVRSLAASLADPTVATLEVLAEVGMLRLHALAAGTTELAVTFDGVTARYQLEVR